MLPPFEVHNNLYTTFARAQPFLPPGILGFLVFLKFVFEEALVWCTRPAEVFLRHRFGVRGHSVFQTLQIVQMGLLVGWFCLRFDPILAAFCLAAAVLAVYHRIEAFRWERYFSPPRYSWSNGEPIPIIWGPLARALQAIGLDPSRFLSSAVISFVWEPLICVLVGGIVWSFSMPLGLYLFCCAGALLAKTVIIHQRMVNIKRDQVDARILSSWLIDQQKKAAGLGGQACFVVRLAVSTQPAKDDKPEPPAASKQSTETTIVADGHLNLRCGQCANSFRIHRKYLGKSGTCKKCGFSMIVKEQSNSAA
jgi:hypothetical protein